MNPQDKITNPPEEVLKKVGGKEQKGTILGGGNIFITFTPTSFETTETQDAREKTAEYVKTLLTAGSFELGPETQFELEQALLEAGFSNEQIEELNLQERHINTALAVQTMGGAGKGGEKFEKAIEEAVKKGVLSPEQQQDLNKALMVIKGFDSRTSELLEKANRNPEIQIQTTPPTSPEIYALPLERQNGNLAPDIKLFFNHAKSLIKEGKQLAGKALKTTTKEAAKAAVKTQVKNAVKSGAKEVLKKGAIWLGEKLGITALGTAIGGPVGTIITIALQILGFLKNIAKKLLSSLLHLLTGEKDTRKALAALGAMMLAGGIFLNIPLLALIGAGTAGLSLLSYIGLGALGAASFGFIGSLIAGIISVAITVFTTPIIIAIATFVLLTLLSVFIINNSALVVPYGGFDVTSLGRLESPYIGVEKEANPNTAPNNQRITINYTVTITAKLSDLTNIDFTYTCAVNPDNNRVCPNVENIRVGSSNFNSFEEAVPNVISKESTYVITYSVTYPAGNFNDSLVTDTFTVAADVQGGTRSQASGVASVCFGNCPKGCFQIVDNAWPWPGSYRAMLEEAIAKLVSEHPKFVEKVCSSSTWGPVNLCYDPPAVSLWGYHTHTSSCDIKFNSGGLTNRQNAVYILTHEASHHLQNIMGSLQSEYEASGALSELPLCTYFATTNPGEGFAEGNALFVELPTFWSSRCTGNYQGLYPIHYNFAKNEVFEE